VHSDLANAIQFSIEQRITWTAMAQLAIFSVVDFLYSLITKFAEQNPACKISGVCWASISAPSRSTLAVSVHA
jgi:hypothetical protein